MLPEFLSVMSWEEFISFFQYPFVWRAVVVGTLIALVAALLGVTLVLKRFSFIGDGLSHVAFGAMAVAAVAGRCAGEGAARGISKAWRAVKFCRGRAEVTKKGRQLSSF